MRLRWAKPLAIGSASVAVAAFGGCVDLFHSTDFPSLCESDPQTMGCKSLDASVLPDGAAALDAGTIAPPMDAADAHVEPTDFCAWDAKEARAKAEHACAWLGACAGPLGNNALGPCFLNALLAYDCRINPARKVNGRLHAYWDCLSAAATCDAVKSCVSPNGAQGCSPNPSEYFGCEGADGRAPYVDNASVRVDCKPDASLAGAENCIAVGQTCTAQGSNSACTGRGGDASCTGVLCKGTELRDCSDGGGDHGVDCALYGAGKCVDLDGGGGASCAANGGAACAATGEVKCDAGVARGCASGTEETVDCAALLGGDASAACTPSVTGSGWDLSRACGTATACPADSCNGKIAYGCSRGGVFSVDCARVIGPNATCELITSETSTRAVCVP